MGLKLMGAMRGGLKKDLRVSRVELGGCLNAFFFLLIGDESGSSLHQVIGIESEDQTRDLSKSKVIVLKTMQT